MTESQFISPVSDGAAAPSAAARPAPAESPLLKAVRQRHERLRSLLAGGLESLSDPEVIHDLRVGSRRLGEAARLLEPFLEKHAGRAVQGSLKALRRAMGDLRDDDVTREHLLKWRMPGALRQVAREVAAGIEAKRAERLAAAGTQMGSASLAGTMVILARVLEDCGNPSVAGGAERQLHSALEALIKKRDKQVRRAFGQAARKQTPEALHAARIAVKKLRYLLELAIDAKPPRGTKKKLALLKRLQQLLGDHHDTHVIAQQLAAHLRDPREKAVRNLAAAWRKWSRQTARVQARRAAEFFAKSYGWNNGYDAF